MTNIKVPLSSNDWNNTGRNPEQHSIIVATIEWIVIILIGTIEWFAIILIATIEWKRARCVLSYCDNDTTRHDTTRQQHNDEDENETR